MFKEFMEEVAAIEKAGIFREPIGAIDDEVAEGEEVIGCIADQPYLMALCMASENRAGAYKDKISQTMTEDEIRRVYEEFRPIADMMWAEIRLYLGVFGGTVGLRKGWTVIKVKDEQLMPELNILELVIPHGALNASGDCGNPNCSVHGMSLGGRQKKIAQA